MSAGRPPLTRSREDYLKALFALAGAGAAPVGALARRLGVSPPSVTNMLGRLARAGLVTRAVRGGSRLTPRGRRAALATVRRHRLVETFLVRVLKLDWAEAHDDAEVLEHHVSDRVLAALDRLMAHPREDPHGHPIPDRRGRLARRTLAPLAALPSGAAAVIREIRDRDGRRMARWKRAGLVPGARVRMRAADAETGLYRIEIAGRGRLVSGGAGLEGVLVERRGRSGT
ncbi:MAG TPA: metal-dependent transcriptional regulator [Candidatus Eisenbacteria bacterium]|nr:metal-dependent transcriptional regulator [Candidatus Eisenbacteria bacterium]